MFDWKCVGRDIVLGLTLGLLAGCATPYQKMGWSGGYDDFRITEDTFEVTFRGNGKTSPEKVSRYLYRRASEVALGNGFSHFLPLIELDRTRHQVVYQSSGYAHGQGNSAFGSSTGYASTVEKPGTMMRIRCFKAPAPEAEGLIDARAYLQYNYPETSPNWTIRVFRGQSLSLGGNINYATGHAVFEATHGTAPKYAGQDKVNPGSVILSGEMMLRYMGWKEAADLILKGMDEGPAARGKSLLAPMI